VDLGVGDPGVVIDDGVNERGPDQRLVSFVAVLAWSRCSVLQPLRSADVSLAAAVGDVSELLDVDVDHRARVVVFVAAHDLTGSDVDVVQPVDPAPVSTA
jgi:hypothetical protein